MNIDPFNANGDDPIKPMDQCDVTLVAENRRIYFNRLNLADHSPRFKRLIYGKHAIPKGGEILLNEDTKFEVVLAALNLLKLATDFESVNCALIVRQEQLITNSIVEDLLKFAEEYRLAKVTKFCEAFLTDAWDIFKPDKFTIIFMAFKYHLRGSLKQVLTNMNQWLRGVSLTDVNLEAILSIASEFSMSQVVARCEQYLLKFWRIEPDKVVCAVELAAKLGVRNALGRLLKYEKHDAPPITDDDLEQILTLAKLYSIPEIISDCEQFILREWVSNGEKAVRAVEIAHEMNLPKIAIAFIPIAARRPSTEVFCSHVSGDIVNPSYLKLLMRRNGLLPYIDTDPLSPKVITDLPENLLTKLFTYLPPNDRLLLSEVCSQFRDISRKEWLEIVDLDLRSIPSVNIGAVLRQTPNVESILARRRVLILHDLLNHSLINLTSMKLYGVTFASGAVVGQEKYTPLYRDLLCTHPRGCGCFQRPAGSVEEQQTVVKMGQLVSSYFENFPQLDELILYQPRQTDINLLPLGKWMSFGLPRSLGSSLTRFLLHNHGTGYDLDAQVFCDSLAQLRKLECLSLAAVLLLEERASVQRLFALNNAFLAALASLQELRELCIDRVFFLGRDLQCKREPHGVGGALMRLPKLQILLVNDVWLETGELEDLIERHSSLEVLFLARVKNVDQVYHFHPLYGIVPEEAILPSRKRFPNGLDGDPLPTLHIFVGGEVALKYSFRESASGASKVYSIDWPMPVFFEVAEVPEIFAGSWLAQQICEGAEFGEFGAEMFWYGDTSMHPVSIIAAGNQG